MIVKNIYIIGEIDDELALAVSQEINEAKNAGAEKIIFKINSSGGSVISALSMYDEISALTCQTEAVILGLCASAATYLALACDKVLMQKNASFMIHRATGGVRGTIEEMERDLEYLEEVENRFIAIYAAKTGLSVEEIVQMMDKTTYMNAEQAYEYKFIDEIIGKDSVLFNVSDLELIDKLEQEKPEKSIIQKVVDIFKSPEAKEEETLNNKLINAENEIVRLTNELESIKVANQSAVEELNNIINEYKEKESQLYQVIDEQKSKIENTISEEVTNRLAAMGYEENDLVAPINKVDTINIAEVIKNQGLDAALNYLTNRRGK